MRSEDDQEKPVLDDRGQRRNPGNNDSDECPSQEPLRPKDLSSEVAREEQADDESGTGCKAPVEGGAERSCPSANELGRGARRLGPLKRNEINPARCTEGVGHKAAGDDNQGEHEQAASPIRSEAGETFDPVRPWSTPVASARHLECDMGVAEEQSRLCEREQRDVLAPQPENWLIRQTLPVHENGSCNARCRNPGLWAAYPSGWRGEWDAGGLGHGDGPVLHLLLGRTRGCHAQPSCSSGKDDLKPCSPRTPERSPSHAGLTEVGLSSTPSPGQKMHIVWRNGGKTGGLTRNAGSSKTGGGYRPSSSMRTQRGAGVESSTCGSSRNAGAAGSRVWTSRSVPTWNPSLFATAAAGAFGSRWRCTAKRCSRSRR